MKKTLAVCWLLLLLLLVVGCGKSEQTGTSEKSGKSEQAEDQPSGETTKLTDNQQKERTDLIERIELLVDDIVRSHDLDGDGVLTTSELLPASRLRINMLVGAKGNPEQLYINTFNNLSTPIENVPYSVFLDFLKKDDPSSLVERDKDGRFSQFVDCAVPIGIGDYCRGFPVLATTPQFFNALGSVEDDHDVFIKFKFSHGRSFVTRSDKYGCFEAVVGAAVATTTNVEIGEELILTHGVPEGHGHDRQFTVVGILQPTRSTFDRRVYVNLEGFYQMADHAKPLDASDVSADEPEVSGNLLDRRKPLPLEQREVTAILIRTVNPVYALYISNLINEGTTAQAVLTGLVERRFKSYTAINVFQLSAWFAARGDGISAEELQKRIVQLLTPLENESR